MCAMQIPNDNEIQPEIGDPEEDEIRGLEDTQAALIQNASEGPDAGSQSVTGDTNSEELMPPGEEPSPGDTTRSVLPSGESGGLPVNAQEIDSTAQTMRVSARLPAEEKPLSEPADGQEQAPASIPLSESFSPYSVCPF